MAFLWGKRSPEARREAARKMYEAGAFLFILKWGLLVFGLGTGVLSVVRQCFVDGIHQALSGDRLFQDVLDSVVGGILWGGLMWCLFAWSFRKEETEQSLVRSEGESSPSKGSDS